MLLLKFHLLVTYLKVRLWKTQRRITRLFKEIERHRVVQAGAKDNSDVFREVRSMIFHLTKKLEDATVSKSITETRIRTARARREIKGRLK